MEFEKWHGLGNDFLVVWADHAAWRARAVDVCDRHVGVGADGVLLATDGDPPAMRIVNADGSEPEMCGNGLRCVVGALAERRGEASLHAVVDTLAGRLDVDATREAAGHWQVVSSLGAARFGGEAVGAAGAGTTLAAQGLGEGHLVSMGNPHWVFFDAPDVGVLEQRGSALEHDRRFAARTNVEFVRTLGPLHYRVDVWERGCGLTRACGTGAAAVAAALVETGRVAAHASVRLELPGGALEVRRRRDGAMVVAGPAVRVYRGRLDV